MLFGIFLIVVLTLYLGSHEIMFDFDKRFTLYGLMSCIWALGIVLFMASCTVKPAPLTLDEQLVQIEADLKDVFANQHQPSQPLSMYQAMAMAVQNNFDNRLAAYEERVSKGAIDLARLNMLPELNIGYVHASKSNPDEITFESAATGNPALETVRFDDKTKQVAEVELSWNVLDFGLSYAQAKQNADQYLIASEHRRKILHHLLQETRIAYWRAAAAQDMMVKIDNVIIDSRDNLQKAQQIEELGLKPPMDILQYQYDVLDSLRLLIEQRKELATAKHELAALLNLPHDKNYVLDFNADVLQKDVPILNLDMHDMELLALINRPELREQGYKTRLAASDLRQEIVSTMPGLNFAVSGNYDSNSLLENSNWLSLAAGFTGNLMRIFTLDERMEQAEARQKWTDLKRRAVAASILSQVHASYTKFRVAQDDYQIYQRMDHVGHKMLDSNKARLDKDRISKSDYLRSRATSLLDRMRLYMAYIDLHEAYAGMVVTLGVDALPAGYVDMPTDQLATEIQARFKSLDYATVHDLMNVVRKKVKHNKINQAKNMKASAEEKQKHLQTIPQFEYLGIHEASAQ